MGLLSVFYPSYVKKKVASAFAMGGLVIQLLCSRLNGSRIEADDDDLDHVIIADAVKRHGHLTTATIYAVVELVACSVFAFKHGLMRGCKHSLPVIRRRTSSTLNVFRKHVIRALNSVARTHPGMIIEKHVTRLLYPYVSAVKVCHNAVCIILGDDYLDTASNYILNRLRRVFLVLTDPLYKSLESFTLKSSHSTIAWMAYIPILASFSMTLFSLSIALAFISAYTFDINDLQRNGKGQTAKPIRTHKSRRRSAFDSREAQQAREERIKLLAVVSTESSSLAEASPLHHTKIMATSSPGPNAERLIYERSRSLLCKTTRTVADLPPSTSVVPEIYIIPAEDSLTSAYKLSTLPRHTRLEHDSSKLLRGDISIGQLSPRAASSRSPAVSAQIDNSGTMLAKGLGYAAPKLTHKVQRNRSKVAAEDDKENVFAGAMKARQDSRGAPSTPPRRGKSESYIDVAALNAAPSKIRPKTVEKEGLSVRGRRATVSDTQSIVDTSVYMTPEGTKSDVEGLSKVAASPKPPSNSKGRGRADSEDSPSTARAKEAADLVVGSPSFTEPESEDIDLLLALLEARSPGGILHSQPSAMPHNIAIANRQVSPYWIPVSRTSWALDEEEQYDVS